MSLDTIKNALLNVEPSSTPEAAIAALVDAYASFAKDAMAGTLPLLTGGVDLGKTAMALALDGMNDDGAGLTKIPAGITAFWVGVQSGLALSFTGATVITPPPHTSLASQFATVAAANVSLQRSKEESVDALAEILYNNAILGGTVTVVTPVFKIL